MVLAFLTPLVTGSANYETPQNARYDKDMFGGESYSGGASQRALREQAVEERSQRDGELDAIFGRR